MRKKIRGRKFSRESSQRKALIKGLIAALFLHERIRIIEERAKEIRGSAEKFLTRAKKGDLASRRYLLRFLPEKIVKKLIEEIAPRYESRKGGYTRIIKMGPRKSDGAKMAIIELIK